MLRLLLLPLFLFTLSMACMGQTFQYSRGWTNGKRAPPAAAVLTNGHNLGLLDLYELSDANSDRRLERCLSHLQHMVGNGLLHRSFANGLAYEASRPDALESEPVRGLNLRSRTSASSSSSNGSSNQINNNNNNENGLYGNAINHRQSSELYEALNAAVAASAPVGESVEPNDYGKQH